MVHLLHFSNNHCVAVILNTYRREYYVFYFIVYSNCCSRRFWNTTATNCEFSWFDRETGC